MDKGVSFVAKVFKAKTRKDKDYFVFRFNVPKEIAETLSLNEGAYVLFRAMRANWYHMLEWQQMETTWNMLPEELRFAVRQSGLPTPGGKPVFFPSLLSPAGHERPDLPGTEYFLPSTSLTGPFH